MCAAFLPASSATSVMMPPTLAPQLKNTLATKPATPPARVPTPAVAALCSKALHRLTLSRLMAGFFWTGDNSVYGSKWKLGLFGKSKKKQDKLIHSLFLNRLNLLNYFSLVDCKNHFVKRHVYEGLFKREKKIFVQYMAINFPR